MQIIDIIDIKKLFESYFDRYLYKEYYNATKINHYRICKVLEYTFLYSDIHWNSMMSEGIFNILTTIQDTIKVNIKLKFI